MTTDHLKKRVKPGNLVKRKQCRRCGQTRGILLCSVLGGLGDCTRETKEGGCLAVEYAAEAIPSRIVESMQGEKN